MTTGNPDLLKAMTAWADTPMPETHGPLLDHAIRARALLRAAVAHIERTDPRHAHALAIATTSKATRSLSDSLRDFLNKPALDDPTKVIVGYVDGVINNRLAALETMAHPPIDLRPAIEQILRANGIAPRPARKEGE